MNIKHIVIVGVGLIGGSIARGLKDAYGSQVRLYGMGKRKGSCKEALRQRVIDAELTPGIFPEETNLIILAMPVEAIVEMLKTLQNIPQKCLIIDTGSTKELICETAEKYLPRHISFIGSHPMAGKEVSGWNHADAELFEGKPWIICPTKRMRPHDLSIVHEMIEELGAKPVILDPELHDAYISLVSHLPMTIATILMHMIGSHNKWKDVRTVAGTGLKDTTRLASEHPQMKHDILLTNADHIIDTLQECKKEMELFISLLEKKDSKGLMQYLNNTKKLRDEWLAAKKI